MKLRWSK